MVVVPATDTGINPSQGQRQRRQRLPALQLPPLLPHPGSLTPSPSTAQLNFVNAHEAWLSKAREREREGERRGAHVKCFKNLKCIIFQAHPQYTLLLLPLPLLLHALATCTTSCSICAPPGTVLLLSSFPSCVLVFIMLHFNAPLKCEVQVEKKWKITKVSPRQQCQPPLYPP